MSADEKLRWIEKKLNDDLASADLQLSLMVAALCSYRHDTILRPFPPMFRKSDATRPADHIREELNYKALVSYY